MAYSADSFVADEQPTTAKWNKLWSNDAAFNDGTGIGAGVINAAHRSQVAKVGSFVVSGNGAIAVTGVGFQPKAVILFTAITGGSASASSRGMSMGAFDASAQGAIMQSDREAHGSASEVWTDRVIDIATIAGGGGSYSDDPTLVKTSLDSDGFTVTASNYGTTRRIIYLAIA